MLKSADALAEHLRPVIEAAIEIEILSYEIEQEDRRDAAVAEARDVKVHHDLYIEVKQVADELYRNFGITRNDWKNADGTILNQVAQLLISAR